MHTVESCPFKVGDMVIYRPSARGLTTDIMSSPSSQLIPGTAYRIIEVQNNAYVIVEGYHHPGGGIYWTEFKAAVT
jgi:hypothetical protein